MLRKILHPLYVLYQVLFAWWAALLVVAITAIIIELFGHYFKIKNADHAPAVIWCKLTCWIFLIPVKVVDRDKYVKKEQNYVFVANHQGMFDIFIMYGYVQKRFKWIMKDALRKMPLLGKACYDT
ncbi:MAG: 1-acyl-sn-glycerol-3-phosphate acyltransferase, partial [Bacteroidaceae bacterium]|nr:1-acyl-sn-glycerol-3-phosphate acyltransferase [Bacteroidaceae bacterium]